MSSPSAALAPRQSRLATLRAGFDRPALLLLPALLFLLVLFIYPMLYGVQLSLNPDEGGPLSNYARFWSDPFLRDTVWLTFRLAIPGTIINVLVALPLAVLMRGRFKGKQFVASALVFPIVLGSVLIGKGLLNYLGSAGWLNRTLEVLGIIDRPLVLTGNYWGVLLAIVIADLPFVFLLLLSYASGLDEDLEKAAAVHGAGPWQRFWKVTLPLLTPGLVTTTALAFVLAFGTFPSALIVGDPAGATRTMGIAAYRSAFQNFDYSMASTVSMLMAAIEVAVVAVFFGLRRLVYRPNAQ